MMEFIIIMDFSEKTGLFIYNAISIAFFLIFLSYRREFYDSTAYWGV